MHSEITCSCIFLCKFALTSEVAFEIYGENVSLSVFFFRGICNGDALVVSSEQK